MHHPDVAEVAVMGIPRLANPQLASFQRISAVEFRDTLPLAISTAAPEQTLAAPSEGPQRVGWCPVRNLFGALGVE